MNLIGILGIVAILGIAFLFSSNRKAIHLRVVGAALALQATIAAIVLFWDKGRDAVDWLSGGVLAVIGFANEGINMVFGPLADTENVGFSFAINVLPIIIFFAALMSVMYHLRVMEWLVRIVGGALHKIIGTGSIESMNAAANIFVGQTEAPLVVKPYLKGLTEAQFFAVCVSGLASIAGTVLAGYSMLGAEMEYLLAAAFMAAPGGLLMAKIIMPDDEYIPPSQHERLQMEPSKHRNVIMAAAAGTSDGLRLAVNIGAMLVAFVALIALFNGLVGGLLGLVGIYGPPEMIELQQALGRVLSEAVLVPGTDRVLFEAGLTLDDAAIAAIGEASIGHVEVVVPVTMQLILGKVFQPLMWLLSIPWHEAQAAGSLFGEKIILNEFVAFANMTERLDGMSSHTIAITTFALCGFANLSSIAILLGGLGVLVPEKRELIGKFGLKAVLAASLSNLMSAALAGIMISFR